LDVSPTPCLPEAGDSFLGFRLLRELGRGAFGRVFLARQGDLADRPVVLKIASNLRGEVRTLAQLQHTNVVPLFSVHWADPFQAVCMPYLGATTLEHVLAHVQARDSLPRSGAALVDALRRGRPAGETIASATEAPTVCIRGDLPHRAPPAGRGPADAGAFPLPSDQAPAAPVPPAIAGLQAMSYVDAVLWLCARLADGLAHAHEHGIIHQDLKPANVLLADHGQPMLLDFNVAEDLKRRGPLPTVLVGRTIHYMAPEQLAACRGETAAVDGRCDLYALGMILYELLAGGHPFPRHTGSTEHVVERELAERRRQPPPLSQSNRQVTPAVDAIVRRCLQPDPRRRYRSARELQEDLDRQRNHLPLRHTPNRRCANGHANGSAVIPGWRRRAASGRWRCCSWPCWPGCSCCVGIAPPTSRPAWKPGPPGSSSRARPGKCSGCCTRGCTNRTTCKRASNSAPVPWNATG
jgi:serine/threonine protein kinase